MRSRSIRKLAIVFDVEVREVVLLSARICCLDDVQEAKRVHFEATDVNMSNCLPLREREQRGSKVGSSPRCGSALTGYGSLSAKFEATNSMQEGATHMHMSRG
jgi:hypothetical protein